MKAQGREDISDVLMASLLTRPMLGMLPVVTKGDFEGRFYPTWTEDGLKPPEADE
jgi:hypothetical protein